MYKGNLMEFLSNILKNRRILLNLVKSDFKNRYLGNHLGIIWAFIQPLIMVSVYWFVFTFGFRNPPISHVPFLLWLLAGMVPWFLISDAIISSGSAIMSQSFLVKKIVFEVKLLPIVKIGSSLLANIAFWILMLIVCLCYGYYPQFIWVQLIYFMFCSLFLSLGFGLLISSIMPFMPDIAHIVSIFIQVLFWATPIFWNKSLLQGHLALIYKLSPFAYIIDGFRDTLINNTTIFVHSNQMVYFWVFNLILFWFGNRTFNKLRPHFADVL